jgi:hypothetical protein
MWLRIFVPSATGLADNGDGPRMTCQLHLIPMLTRGVPQDFAFAQFTYKPGDSEWCGGSPYASSTLLLMRLAAHLTAPLGFPGALDVRVIAILWCVIIGVVFGLITAALGLSRRGLFWLAAAAFLVAADAAFTDYAASVFGESGGFLGVLACCAALAFMLRPERWWRAAGWLLFMAAGVFTIWYKTQGLSLVAPLMLCAVLAITPRFLPTRRRNWRALTALLLTASLTVGLFSVATLRLADRTDPGMSQINQFNLVFSGILPASSDPAEAVEALGGDPALAKYTGRSYYTKPNAMEHPAWPSFADQLTRQTTTVFMAQHPLTTLSMLQTSAKSLFEARPSYLGSYAPQAGHPSGAQDCRICVVSSLLPAFSGRLSLILYTALSLGFILLVHFRVKHSPSLAVRQLALITLFLVGVSLVQIVTHTAAEALEPVKHLTLATFTFALAAVFAIAGVLCSGVAPSPSRESEGRYR